MQNTLDNLGTAGLIKSLTSNDNKIFDDFGNIIKYESINADDMIYALNHKTAVLIQHILDNPNLLARTLKEMPIEYIFSQSLLDIFCSLTVGQDNIITKEIMSALDYPDDISDDFMQAVLSSLDLIDSDAHLFVLDKKMVLECWPTVQGYKFIIEIKLINNEANFHKGISRTLDWDTYTIEVRSRRDLLLRFAKEFCFLNDDEKLITNKALLNSKPRKFFSPDEIMKLTGKMNRYYPERFNNTRKYINSAKQNIAKMTPSIGRSEAEIQGAVNAIVDSYNGILSSKPLRYHDRDTDTTQTVNRELTQYTMFRRFISQGKQIFDLTPELVSMLRKTSTDDIPMDYINPPFPFFYIHFGALSDVSLQDGWLIEGVYVEHMIDVGHLQFTFTSRPDDLSVVADWTQNQEPQFAIAIDLNAPESKGTFINAFDYAFSQHEKEVDQTIAIANIMPEVEGAKNSIGEKNTARLICERKHAEIIRPAVDLTVNAMCYITSYPEDINETWTSEAKRHAEATFESKKVSNTKIEKELRKKGYRKIRFCGQSLYKDESTKQSLSTGTGEKMATHWRRGHWRKQAYGPKHSLRKWKLVPPVMINRPEQEANIELQGRIYLSEKPEGH